MYITCVIFGYVSSVLDINSVMLKLLTFHHLQLLPSQRKHETLNSKVKGTTSRSNCARSVDSLSLQSSSNDKPAINTTL